MNNRWRIPALAIVLGLACGCEPRVGTRSPTPDQAPDRYARALQDEAEARRANQEGEARFMRSQRVELADAETAPAMPSPDEPHHETP